MRGIGLGIMVAAAICICASLRNNKNGMTDAQIKARAAELGMIDSSNTLSTIASEDNDDKAEVVPEITTIPQKETDFVEVAPEEIDTTSIEEEVISAEKITEPEEVTEEAADTADEPEQEDTIEAVEEEPSESAGDTVTIVVDKGNGSDTVARKLADAGLVSNALEYDKYLMANGYDRRIAAGTHKIPKGASNEEIAGLLVSKQD